MKNVNIAENIAKLRKSKGVTQEQLAATVNVSAQAVSKWETGTSQPDVQTLPLIADYFGVSIDYLFYGADISYDDIYEKLFKKVASHPQMSEESYKDAYTAFWHAHHGISHGNVRSKEIVKCPTHISNAGGLSLTSGKGYGAIITRSFFESISKETADFAVTLLPALADRSRFLVCMAIISMSDISFEELKEKLGFTKEELRAALDELIKSQIIIEKKSKHASLGLTYDVNDMYHTCLCVLIATIEMQRYSLKGISCCMGYGDYPVSF